MRAYFFLLPFGNTLSWELILESNRAYSWERPSLFQSASKVLCLRIWNYFWDVVRCWYHFWQQIHKMIMCLHCQWTATKHITQDISIKVLQQMWELRTLKKLKKPMNRPALPQQARWDKLKKLQKSNALNVIIVASCVTWIQCWSVKRNRQPIGNPKILSS